MAPTQHLSQKAYDRLKAEHDELTTVGRVDIARKIEAARELGDLKENGDYHAAKDHQGQMEARIRQLAAMLEAASGRYVLRRQPSGALLASAHAVDREYRVLQALHGGAVPVAAPLHLCTDASVIGSMFYVMECVAGVGDFLSPVQPALAVNVLGRVERPFQGFRSANAHRHVRTPDEGQHPQGVARGLLDGNVAGDRRDGDDHL